MECAISEISAEFLFNQTQTQDFKSLVAKTIKLRNVFAIAINLNFFNWHFISSLSLQVKFYNNLNAIAHGELTFFTLTCLSPQNPLHHEDDCLIISDQEEVFC